MYGWLALITPRKGGFRKFDKIALFIACLGTIGLGIVGAVNEEENNPIHSGMRERFIAFLIFQVAQLCFSSATSFTCVW